MSAELCIVDAAVYLDCSEEVVIDLLNRKELAARFAKGVWWIALADLKERKKAYALLNGSG